MSETVFRRGALCGDIALPGDKSISHRALLLAANNPAATEIFNLNPGLDVAATAGALRASGIQITGNARRTVVRGGSLRDPIATVDCMNSGSTARMFMGLCAGAALQANLDGDASLRERPMEPLAAQLRAFGARIETAQGTLPAHIQGSKCIQTHRFILLESSAQVKSALLLAGFFAGKPVTISGDRGSRDHTERMLRFWGAAINSGTDVVRYQPGPVSFAALALPGDFSAAAFFIVAATIAPQSRVSIRDLGLNPTRTGLIDALTQMGAAIEITNRRERSGEPLGDIQVRYSALRAINVGPELALRNIDEILALAVACACAEGTSTISGIRTLRTKESDRINAAARLLQSVGIEVTPQHNGMTIHGGVPRAKSTVLESRGDHRTVMAAATLACAAGPLRIDDAAPIATSFPSFTGALARAQSGG